MTPSKESTERARQFLLDAHASYYEDDDARVPGAFNQSKFNEDVNSLALEFDRIAIEAQEKEAFQCMALFRGARNTNDVYLLIHDRARDHKAQLVEHPR